MNQKQIHTLWHSEKSHRCKWNIHHIEPFLICSLHRKLTYPLKNSGSVRQSFPFQSSPLFLRSTFVHFLRSIPFDSQNPYDQCMDCGILTYIYHKNQATCRCFFSIHDIHGSYWKHKQLDICLNQANTTRETEVDASWFLAWLMLEAGEKVKSWMEKCWENSWYLRIFKVNIYHTYTYIYYSFTYVSWLFVEVWALSPLFWGLSNETRAPGSFV